MKRIFRYAVIGLPLVFLVPPPAQADEQSRNHLSVFVGAGLETKEGREDEWGFAVGIEYERRFHKHWGIGAVIEDLGGDTVRNVVVIVPLSFHPVGNWRFFAGPGMEFTSDKDKFAFRVGAGYEIHLSGPWSLVPEVFVDLIETGEQTYIGGISFAYAF